MAKTAEEEVYNRAMTGYDSGIEQESMNYRNAQRLGDQEEMTRAFMQLAAYKSQKDAAQAIAADHARSMQPAPQAPVRGGQFFMTEEQVKRAAASLDDDEIEAAAISGVSEETYAKNREMLRWQYSTGVRSNPGPRFK